MSTFTTFKNTGGGQPVKARKSSLNAYSMSRARTAPFLYLNSTTMRRKQFTPTPAEVEYWRKIHELNGMPVIKPKKPVPVTYIVRTVEILTIQER